MKNATLENFKKEVHKLEQKNLEDVANSVAKILGALLVNKLGSFERHSQALVVEGSGWEKHTTLYRQELEATLKDAVSNCKEKLLNRLQQTSQKMYELQMKTFIHDHTQRLPEKLNEILREEYIKEVNEYNKSMLKVLKEGFAMSSEGVFEFLSSSESQVNQFCCGELKSLFNNLANQFLLRKFSLGFKRDDQGNNRNWKDLEESKINDLFEVNKKLAEDAIDAFKLVGFPKNITQLDSDSLEEDAEDFLEDSRQTSKFSANDHIDRAGTEDLAFKRKLSSVHYKILTEEEVTTVRNKFYEDIEFCREEAIARHRSNAAGDVPWWMWVLLAWFASDNIMNWLASPLFFYPLILLASVCLVLHQMGILSLLVSIAMPFVKGTVNGVLAKVGIRI